MAKRKAPPNPKAAGKTKRPRATVTELQSQNHHLNEHLNMCVARINLLTEHVQFLHKKLLERTKLYNNEFRRLDERCDELEEPHLEKYRNFEPEIFGYFGEENHETALDPIQTVKQYSFEEDFMSEQELTDAIANCT